MRTLTLMQLKIEMSFKVNLDYLTQEKHTDTDTTVFLINTTFNHWLCRTRLVNLWARSGSGDGWRVCLHWQQWTNWEFNVHQPLPILLLGTVTRHHKQVATVTSRLRQPANLTPATKNRFAHSVRTGEILRTHSCLLLRTERAEKSRTSMRCVSNGSFSSPPYRSF